MYLDIWVHEIPFQSPLSLRDRIRKRPMFVVFSPSLHDEQISIFPTFSLWKRSDHVIKQPIWRTLYNDADTVFEIMLTPYKDIISIRFQSNGRNVVVICKSVALKVTWCGRSPDTAIASLSINQSLVEQRHK